MQLEIIKWSFIVMIVAWVLGVICEHLERNKPTVNHRSIFLFWVGTMSSIVLVVTFILRLIQKVLE